MTQAMRSLVPVTRSDLLRLGQVTREDREDLFARLPPYRVLADRILAVALCQGAALHFLDGQNGVKDFDVWTFYAAHSEVRYPPRRRAARDFGNPKFGQSPDRPEFVGRRVDLHGRSLEAVPDEDPTETLRSYLLMGGTRSARHLATKAVVMIEPAALTGTVVWWPGIR